MASSWYYAENGERRGPIPDSDIRNLVDSGVVREETLVWHEALDEWTPASETELASQFSGQDGENDQSQCVICSKMFSQEDLVEIDGANVCAECKPVMLRRLQEGKGNPGYYHYGGFWIRFVAKFIDGLIINLIGFPLTVVTYTLPMVLENNENASHIMLGYQVFSTIAGVAIALTYNAWFLVRKNATPGKMVFGLKVINADGSESISAGKAIGRYLAELVSTFILYIGYIMAAFDDQKRTLHDRMCNTRVVYKK